MKHTNTHPNIVLNTIIILLSAFQLVGCNAISEKPAAVTKNIVVVYAGISLTEPFQKIEKAFEDKNDDIDVQISFATGQQQLEQMKNGAVVDIFAAAKEQQMLDAITLGFVPDNSQQVFARNRIVVIMPNNNPGNIQELSDLANPGVSLIVGADKTAVGQYTIAFLDKITSADSYTLDYKESVLRNVISYETDVKAVLTKIILGEGDAGIVFVSDFVSNKDKLLQIEIPDSFNEMINYTIAITNEGQPNKDARQFLDFVMSSDGQEIVEKFGFLRK